MTRTRRVLLRSLALLLSTVVLGLLVTTWTPGLGHAYPFWPAAGVAVALVIADGPVLLPAVAIGSLLINLLLQSSAPLLALVLACGATLQTAVAARLGRRLAGAKPHLRTSREIVGFLLVTGPLSCVIGAAVSVIASQVFGILTPAELPQAGFTWWAGDVLGVVVVTPITLMLLPEMHEAWDGRRLKLLLPSLLLLLAVELAYGQAVALNNQGIRADLKALAMDARYSVLNNLDRHAEAIDSVRRLFAASEFVSAEEFHAFTDDVLKRLPGLQGLSWNPLVMAGERQAFERQQASDPLLSGYRITERNAQGELVAAGPRRRYVPVGYIEPLLSNRPAVGFDILSNPLRADAIRRAERSESLQATDPITLVQEQGDQKGVLVLDPLKQSDGRLSGFAVGVYRLGDLLASSFSKADSQRWQGIGFELHSRGIGGRQELLARYGPSRDLMQGWSVDVPVNFAGQNWTLSVLPTKPALIQRQSTLPQQLLLACLLLVILNQAFLLVVTGKEQLERREAQISHYLASRDPLTDLLNRRAFMASLEQARSEADMGPVTHALLVFDLDHFKPINDTAGHEAGDHALKQLSQCVSAVLRRDDVLALLGGDEFAVILRNCTPGDVPGIAAKLLAAIKNLEINFGGQRFVVTASLGIRCLDRRAGPLPSSSDLLRDADQACYQAKDRGRNHWVMVADAHPHL